MEYQEFKKQYMPKHLSLYEKLCNFSEKIIKISPDRKKAPLIQENIDISHLNVTPTGVISFAYLAPLVIVFFGVLFSFALLQSMFFVMFFLLFPT